MIAIVCVDDKMGTMFNNRRLSRDKAIVARVLEQNKSSIILMNEYSSKLFSEHQDRIKVSNNFLKEAHQEDICFIENTDELETEMIEKIVIYRWNRRYPADKHLKVFDETSDWKLESSYEFKGNSHDKITEEVYTR